MRRLLFWMALSALPLWGEGWKIPEVTPVDRSLPQGFMASQKVVNGCRLFWSSAGRQGVAIQLQRGRQPLWRVRLNLADLGVPLRYEGHNDKIVVLRCAVLRRREVGDLAVALNLADGSLAWAGQPVLCARERPGGPNLQKDNRLAEIYYSPQLEPVLFLRRVSDGQPIFYRDIPSPDGQPFDLMDRRVVKLGIQSDGVAVSLMDKSGHYHKGLFALQDGSLKKMEETEPPAPSPVPQPAQLKRKGKKRFWISPGSSTSGLKQVKSKSN